MVDCLLSSCQYFPAIAITVTKRSVRSINRSFHFRHQSFIHTDPDFQPSSTYAHSSFSSMHGRNTLKSLHQALTHHKISKQVILHITRKCNIWCLFSNSLSTTRVARRAGYVSCFCVQSVILYSLSLIKAPVYKLWLPIRNNSFNRRWLAILEWIIDNVIFEYCQLANIYAEV